MALSTESSSCERSLSRDEEKQPVAVKSEAASDPDDFPDGGSKAWSVVAGAWCCLFASFGWINCIGIFQYHYENNDLRDYLPSTVAWITSIETSMMYMSTIINGKIYDNYGPRPLLLFGTLAHVFGLMMTSLAREYYQFFLAQSICSAIGAAALFSAATGPVGSWFKKRRAFAFGIMASGSSLCGVVLPFIVVRLIPRVGFPWAMRTCAFIFLFLLSIALLTVRTRVPPQPKPWNIKYFVQPMTERPFLLNTLGLWFFLWGVFIPFNFLTLEAEHRGMAPEQANYQIAILNGASFFGRILPGWLGDKIGRFNIMIVTCCLSTLLVLGLWIPARTQGATVAFSTLFGFTSGTYVSLAPALIQQLSRVSEIGVRLGVAFSVMSIAALSGNPIAGALIAINNGEYLYLKVFCGITMVVGTMFLLLARSAQVGWKWKRI